MLDKELLASCEICPRKCGADRLDGETGYCLGGAEASVASYHAHFGEERPLVGRRGSGTIFFAGCNLQCCFCQNADISTALDGVPFSAESLAGLMLEIEGAGCHNINFVTPTHFAVSVYEAAALARRRGLAVPIVYNCGGYESADILEALAGTVDIYMPDVKFFDSKDAEAFCGAPDYPEIVRAALKEMHRQVGDLDIRDGIARCGLLIRHLVMPGRVEDTKRILNFIADEISDKSYVNVMPQYRPVHRARGFPDIDRRISAEEFAEAVSYASKLGLRLD